MSGIAASLRLDGRPIDPAELTPMMRVLERRGPDGTDTFTHGPVVLGCARLDTLPEEGPQPVTVRGVTVVADARLDNRDELEKVLNMHTTAPEAALIAAGVGRWGEAAPERLEGDFVFIAWNGTQLIAARDRFGVKPLFYAESAGKLLIASELSALTAHAQASTDANRSYFLEQLAARIPLTERTPFNGCRRIVPGNMLIVEPRRGVRGVIYYRCPTRVQSIPFDEAVETTRCLFDEAVELRLRSTRGVACDVSGGMDSTSIYATAYALGKAPTAVSLISDVWPTLDERHYSRELIGGRPWCWVRAEAHTPFASSLKSAALFDEPIQDVIFPFRPALNRLAKGRVILSGHGGDALMTGSSGTVGQLVKRGALLAAYRTAKAWADTHDLKLWEVIIRALQPGTSTLGRLPWASRKVAGEARSLSREVAKRIARQAGGNVDAANFLLSTEPGLRQQPVGPYEMRYPFLYRPLVEFALAIPSAYKMQGNLGKRVLRRAMRDRLPRRTVERTSKTDYLSAYAYGLHRHWEGVETWLREPLLAELNILDARGFRALARELHDGKSERAGEAIYALADEAWLRSRFLGMTPSPDALRREVERR